MGLKQALILVQIDTRKVMEKVMESHGILNALKSSIPESNVHQFTLQEFVNCEQI